MTSPGHAATMTRTLEELWLDTLERVISRAAHEVKGALNGVAVNLEVVRSRIDRGSLLSPDDRFTRVSRYADIAVEQLAIVVAMNEAVLWLARPARATG